ncbi:G-type lectin S-receptor-like serine/threonine-protein kinase CES101 [Cornus florida]|uniref:G-type lectin S-receptor-like serine/threonine-protein kinase CES101 n=1 Tax=Cornus florida TaxID=4283 RepID=UPI00289FE932|nr:G-type lectin S-receptor-like serine/threonine-protein kinase CES101 [Cornus florida]
MATREGKILFLLGFSFCILISFSYQQTDTLLQGHSIRDYECLASANGTFSLQFFTINTRVSKDRYFGILFRYRYGRVQNCIEDSSDRRYVVWVANRDNPIRDTSGNLMMHSNGTLKLSYSNNGLIELSSVVTISNTSATLLDTGNFVLREVNLDGSTGKLLWQSFDYPTHMLIADMKIGVNFRTGHNWSLTSWLSDELPASGPFTLGVDPHGVDQLIMWLRGNVYWTSGPWNGQAFEYMDHSSYPEQKLPDFRFVSNENEKYFTFSTTGALYYDLYYMDLHGEVSGFLPSLGGCYSINTFRGPSEKLQSCRWKKLPDCRNDNYYFHGHASMDPYGSNDGLMVDESPNTTLFDCEDQCLRNCSCVAYAPINDNGTGCQIWLKGMKFDSFDISVYPIPIYALHSKKRLVIKWRKWLAIAIGGALVVILFCYLCYVRLRRVIKEKKDAQILLELGVPTKYKDKKKGHELQVFNFESIVVATNNFSDTNKLGEGGYGPVYKGNFPEGQVIAVKRLSRSSGQGLVEFKNEILLIAKLQHNNLVRLLGCCIEGEEKMLIYEYMPNHSLDFFLFEPSKKSSLNWNERITIIEGIAQGLLYLHKYSRFRIIHRDLKASNILLDEKMNPKISDFGMAKIFGENESEANTKRIVGTRGYMSPEYLMQGIFSIKSDVFSFGVLLLEIISGKKSHSCYHYERPLNLIGYAWELWRENRGLELIDPTLENSYQTDEVLRCIHVGLLCVQDNPINRPTMSDVVSMLTKETTTLSTPQQPAFFIGGNVLEADTSQGMAKKISFNNVSISEMEAR